MIKKYIQSLPWPILLLLLVILTRLCVLVLSFYSGDEATYSALASRILSGEWPYAGAVDHKPIGIEMTYAMIYGLVGRNQLIFVRILFLLVIGLTGWILSKAGERITNRPQGRWAGLFYVLVSTWGSPGDTQAANTELFLNAPLCLAAALLIPTLFKDTKQENTRMLLIGVLTGVAALYKYQAALAGAAWAFAVFFSDSAWRARLRQLSLLAVGFLLMAGLYVGLFYITDHWDAFLFWGWGFNFRYMSTLSGELVVYNALRYTLWTAGLWLPLFLCLKKPPAPLAKLVFPWMATMLVATAAGGRFFPHYYLMALPPLCLWAAHGVWQVTGWRRKLSMGLTLIFTVGFVVFSWLWYVVKPNLQRYDDGYREVSAWIKAHSDPEDQIFVWGNSPELYYYSDRVMGTRFPFCNYHTGKIWGSPLDDLDATGTEAFIVQRAWDELLQDLNDHPPRYIIDGGAGRLDRFDRHPISRYPLLADFVSSHYLLKQVVGGVPIYSFQPPQGAKP